MVDTVHTRPDGGLPCYATTPAEDGEPEAGAQDAGCGDDRLLHRLDDPEGDRYGVVRFDAAALQQGLRVLCRALAATLESRDRELLEAVVRRCDDGEGFPPTGRGGAPDWARRVDQALRATTRVEATRALTLVADELEHGRAGSGSTHQARRWWRLAEICGSDRARARLLYIAMRAGDKAAARVARDRCLRHLRAGNQRTEADLVAFSRTNLLALEAALALDDGELAALVMRHLAQADLLSCDDDKLARLRALALAFHAGNPKRADEPGAVRVIRSHVAAADGREKEMLSRLSPLMAPLPLAPWPADLAWADVLDAEFPWLANVTDELRRQASMRMQMGAQALRIDPLLMLGGSGIGKSSYQRRLGELIGVPAMMQSLAGAMDNMVLKGSARGWGSSRPGAILDFMAASACPNPVVLLDEIDKASDETRNGNVWNTLLAMLERSTAARLHDEFVLGEVDFSHVNWMATANDISRMPGTLRSRLRIVETRGPGPGHFDIVYRNVLRDAARDLGVRVAMLPPLAPEVVEAIRAGFMRNPNMRVIARVTAHALAAASTWRPDILH